MFDLFSTDVAYDFALSSNTFYAPRDVRAKSLWIRHNDSLFTQEKEPQENDVIFEAITLFGWG